MRDELRIHCNRCSRNTRHGVLREYLEALPDNEAINWQVVQCAGCDSISFYEEHSVGIEETLEVTESYVYPTRQYRAPKFFADAPERLDQLYRDTIDAFNNQSLLLCAGGLRALVEGICANRGIVDGPLRDSATGDYVVREDRIVRSSQLVGKIEGLAENGILTPQQVAALHEHRYLGNRALHELETPDTATLEVAINLIEHTMAALYDVPAQANALRQGRRQGPA